MSNKLQTDILILGAGIGGYETFRTLNKLIRRWRLNKTITIVDRNNYFTFVPLLHEVASGSVEPGHSAISLREIIYRTPHRFIKTEVQKIDPEKKTVATSEGDISYEYCVAGLGSEVNFFGVPGADTLCYGVRTLNEAMRLRAAIIRKLEDSRNTTAITVVGGGASGVEVAGQLISLVRRDFKKLYPEDKVIVNLVEAGAEVAAALPFPAQRAISQRLKRLGVKLHLGAAVQQVEPDKLILKDGKRLKSDITVWCAGIGNVAGKFLPAAYSERGRLPVTEFLISPKADTLYGVGDMALAHNPGSAVFFPQLGETAHAEGGYIARHIAARLKNKAIKPFHFQSKGFLMPIGERYGVAIFGKMVLTGLFAWWLRRTVYLMFMPGLRLKIKLALDWTLRLFGFSDIIAVEDNKKN